MPFFKKKDELVLEQIAPFEWEQEEIFRAPEENGSTRVGYVSVSSKEICKRQLDPRIVDLEALIEQGITIDPGSVAEMLNLTDPADIEQYNREYVQHAFKYLKENAKEIFKKLESNESKSI